MAKVKFSEFDLITSFTNEMLVGYNPTTLKNIRFAFNLLTKKVTVSKAVSYIILDDDGIDRINGDTTSGDITITLPTRADNLNRRIEIAHVIGGTNKIIIVADGGESKITADGLAAIWLPKIGDYIVLQECADSGFWEVVDEKITSQLILNGYAGYGDASNSKIMRFTNAVENIGNLFSENHSTGYNSNTEGLEITINRSGLYSYKFTLSSSGALAFGVSKNSSETTINIQSITITNISAQNIIPASTSFTVSGKEFFPKGTVLRAHTDGSAPAATVNLFSITAG